MEVAIKQAAVDTAQANIVLAQANVRGLIGQARSNRFKLARAIEDVDNQVALIRARIAAFLVLLMKRSVAEKGAHAAAE